MIGPIGGVPIGAVLENQHATVDRGFNARARQRGMAVEARGAGITVRKNRG